MADLISKDWLEEHQMNLSEWQQDAFHKFGHMINDSDQMYPCLHIFR